MRPRNIYPFILVVIMISCVVISIKFFPSDAKDQHELKIEFLKSTIQLFLISIIGGILIYEFNRIREKSRNNNEFKKQLLSDLTESYNRVKKVRRILKANVIKQNELNGKMMYPAFESQMKDLTEAQLEFESIQGEVELFSNAFEQNKIWSELMKETRSLEVYLNKIVKEYEGTDPLSKEIDVPASIHLKGFISDAFKTEFSEHFHVTHDLLQKEILGLPDKQTRIGQVI